MASLRIAARKLCGQRAAPVVAVGEQGSSRLLLARLLCDRADGSIARPSGTCAAPNNNYSAIKNFAARYAEFREKKEELYNICAELNDSTPNSQMTKLCQQLSVQIKPRPNDLDWRMYRSVETWSHGLLHFMVVMGASATLDFLIEVYRDYMSKRKARGTDARAVLRRAVSFLPTD